MAKDVELAVKWWRKAAEQGHMIAQRDLAHAYSLGKAVEQNFSEAAFWYRKAAEQGERSSQFQLGVMLSGLVPRSLPVVPKNVEEAIHWLKKASAQGHEMAPKALFKLTNPSDSTGFDFELHRPLHPYAKSGCLGVVAVAVALLSIVSWLL